MLLIVSQNSFNLVSGFFISVNENLFSIFNSDMCSSIPNSITPPHVLANAEYISPTNFEISLRESLHSKDILSPYFNNSKISSPVIIHLLCYQALEQFLYVF